MDSVSGAGYGPAGSAIAGQTSAQPSAAYSLAARVAVARSDSFSPAPTKTVNPQMNAALLARAAIEEELRKKGGGGGGGGGSSIKSYNPTLWIPYSFKLMAQSIDQTRAFFAQAFQQLVNLIPNALNQFSKGVMNSLANLSGKLTSPIVALVSQMQKQANLLLDGMVKTPLNMAIGLGSNVSHLANMIANALTQGLRKLVQGKDEKDDALEARKKNDIYEDEDALDFLERLDSMSTPDTNASSATQSIKGHIDNVANQLTRWANSFNK